MKNNDIKTIRRFFVFLKPCYRQGILIGLVLVLSSGLAVLSPFLYGQIVDQCLIPGKAERLIFYVAAVIGLTAFQEILWLQQVNLSTLIQRDVFIKIRMNLYDKFLHMPQSYFSKEHSGKLMARMTSDVDAVQNLLLVQFVYFVQNCLVSILIVCVIAYLDWRMLLVMLSFLPVLYFLFFVFRKGILSASREVQEQKAMLMQRLQEDFSLVRIIQSFPSMHHRIGQTYELLRDAENAKRVLRIKNSLASSATVSITIIGIVVIWGFGGIEATQGKITIGTLVALSFYTNYINDAFYSTYNIITGFFSSIPAAERIFEVLDLNLEVENHGLQDKLEPGGYLSFQNVKFGYEREKNILQDVSFTANSGELVGITGFSGEGKTTIANLAGRFYEPNKGIISLNGLQLKEYKLEFLRKNIAIVPQEDYLFDASIRDNILMGRLELTTEAFNQAVELAGICDFAADLKDGYDTEIGEKGVLLSGGQRKRISIARALLGDPYVIILDEATANLDEMTEAQIFESIRRISSNRIIIFISHKISNLMYADQILQLIDGGINEYDDLKEYINARKNEKYVKNG